MRHTWARLLVIAAMTLPSPSAFAQSAIDVGGDVDRLAGEVNDLIQQEIQRTAARDPELAALIERNANECIRDLSDGQIERLAPEIEGLREAEARMTEKMGQEFETRIAEARATGNEQMAQDMQRAMEMFRSFDSAMGVPEFSGPEGFRPGPGGTEGFRGPEGMEMMRGMDGEAFRPTPEFMGAMREMFHDVMRDMTQDTEMRDFARFTGEGMAREMFEHMDFGPGPEGFRPGPEGFQGGQGREGEFRMAEGFQPGQEFSMPEGFNPEGFYPTGPEGFQPMGPEGYQPMGPEGFHGPEGYSPEQFFEGPHDGPQVETMQDFYRDIAENFRELYLEPNLTENERREIINEIQIGISDIQQQQQDSRYAATLNAVEVNLSPAERDSILSGTPRHEEFFAEVDPGRPGEEHLHVDYHVGNENPTPHVDADVAIHDHHGTLDPSDDQNVGQINHIPNVCAGGPNC